MNEPVLSKRPLTITERTMLEKETKKFSDIGYISKNVWKKFPIVYVLHIETVLVGACAIVPLKNWIKIGPLIMRQKYQGKGYGKLLLKHIIKTHENDNLYIGSSHPAVQKMSTELGFKKLDKFPILPQEIKIYLFSYVIQRLSVFYVIDALKKKIIMKRGPYHYFLKMNK